jgi:hypothetical protein
MGDAERRAREDLEMIRRLMEDGRREVVDRGKHFIIWGVISAVGAALTYAFVVAEGAIYPQPALVWSGLLVAGWSASAWVGWRDGRSPRVKTLARRLMTGVWVASAISLTLLGLAGIWGGILSHVALPGVMSAVVGAPVLVTMVLTGERWLGLVAGGWWLGGAVMLFLSGPYSLLLMAAMSVLLLAVPGVVLNGAARRRAGGARAGRAVDVA